jgi:P pilus assembly chaperone PapD
VRDDTTGATRRLPTGRAWRALVSLLAVGVAMAGLPQQGVAQISVDRVELFLVPGVPDRATAVIMVANEGTRPMQASVYTADWDRDSTGGNRFFPLGAVKESCGQMVQAFPAAMRLEPGTQQAVRVTVQGADSIAASCWGVVFIEASDVQQVQGRSVQAVLRPGVKYYLEPAAANRRDGEIEAMYLDAHALTAEEMRVTQAAQPDTSRKDVVLHFRNLGGIQVRPTGTIEIRRDDNSLVSSVPIPEFPVLPGAMRTLRIPMPALAAGRHVAIALIDYGGAEIAGGQVEFTRP